jgi:hypothetical protein
MIYKLYIFTNNSWKEIKINYIDLKFFVIFFKHRRQIWIETSVVYSLFKIMHISSKVFLNEETNHDQIQKPKF